jgi:ribosomal protein RSM22 (predicted rRNA methylase)
MSEARLPAWLIQALSQKATSFPAPILRQAYSDLSHRYHSLPQHAGVRNLTEAIAYTLARLPATYAVVQSVLQQLPEDFSPQSVLDLGAGPGTATWAAITHFPNITQIHCVEQDSWMLTILKQLESYCPQPIQITQQNYTKLTASSPVDLVIMSYSLNELEASQQWQTLERLKAIVGKYLVILVPGTPHHFAQLKNLRHHLINSGWTIQAPCPHQQACPMDDGKDWCHFATRLPRTRDHQFIKEASLNYEDEKYSYLIATPHSSLKPHHGRIIKRPLKRSGHIVFDICQKGQLQRMTLSKKDSGYTKAKKQDWGDTWVD